MKSTHENPKAEIVDRRFSQKTDETCDKCRKWVKDAPSWKQDGCMCSVWKHLTPPNGFCHNFSKRW